MSDPKQALKQLVRGFQAWELSDLKVKPYTQPKDLPIVAYTDLEGKYHDVKDNDIIPGSIEKGSWGGDTTAKARVQVAEAEGGFWGVGKKPAEYKQIKVVLKQGNWQDARSTVVMPSSTGREVAQGLAIGAVVTVKKGLARPQDESFRRPQEPNDIQLDAPERYMTRWLPMFDKGFDDKNPDNGYDHNNPPCMARVNGITYTLYHPENISKRDKERIIAWTKKNQQPSIILACLNLGLEKHLEQEGYDAYDRRLNSRTITWR